MNITVETTSSFDAKMNISWQEVLSKSLEEICYQCLVNMQQEVPVDTGKLQQSLTANFISETEKQITSDVEYWLYVNYGTYKMSANPFIERALADLKMSNVLENVVINTLRSAGAI